MVLVTKRSWDLQRAYLGKEKKKENPPVNAGLVQNAENVSEQNGMRRHNRRDLQDRCLMIISCAADTEGLLSHTAVLMSTLLQVPHRMLRKVRQLPGTLQ